MQFFYGPNQRYYQFATLFDPYYSKGYGYGPPAISTDRESRVGEFVVGRQLYHYRLTSGLAYKTIIGSGVYFKSTVQYVSTIAPFTTGMITGIQPFGRTTTVHTLTGYDNRTTTSMGEFSGVVSLVRPRLVHTYLKEFDPNDPIRMKWATASSWQIDFHFLPEPAGTAMVATGLTALAGLYRKRSRGCVGNRAAEDACGGEDAEHC